jgi:hypothetical protein
MFSSWVYNYPCLCIYNINHRQLIDVSWCCLLLILLIVVALWFFLFVVYGCCCLLLIIVGCCWLLLVIVGYFWLYTSYAGSKRTLTYTVVLNCKWLPGSYLVGTQWSQFSCHSNLVGVQSLPIESKVSGVYLGSQVSNLGSTKLSRFHLGGEASLWGLI